MIKQYQIPVLWQMCGKISVKANSLEEAIDKTLREAPLPKDQWYIDDSLIIDNDNLQNLS